MADNRFTAPGTDERFPAPGTDTRFATLGTDARFPTPGTDAYFSGSGPVAPPAMVDTAAYEFWDGSDLATLWADDAKTTLAGIGDTVARVSGQRGLHDLVPKSGNLATLVDRGDGTPELDANFIEYEVEGGAGLLSGLGGATLVIGCRNENITSTRSLLSAWRDSDGSDLLAIKFASGAPALGGRRLNGDAHQFYTHGSVVDADTVLTAIADWTAGTAALRVDGVESGGVTFPSGGGNSDTGGTGISVGGNVFSDGGRIDGAIWRVAIFQVAASSADLGIAEAWAAQRTALPTPSGLTVTPVLETSGTVHSGGTTFAPTAPVGSGLLLLMQAVSQQYSNARSVGNAKFGDPANRATFDVTEITNAPYTPGTDIRHMHLPADPPDTHDFWIQASQNQTGLNTLALLIEGATTAPVATADVATGEAGPASATISLQAGDVLFGVFALAGDVFDPVPTISASFGTMSRETTGQSGRRECFYQSPPVAADGDLTITFTPSNPAATVIGTLCAVRPA